MNHLGDEICKFLLLSAHVREHRLHLFDVSNLLVKGCNKSVQEPTSDDTEREGQIEEAI